MLKKFAVNTVSSIVVLVLTGIVFTFLGIFVGDLLGSFSVLGLIALFGAVLGFGYYIGRQLHSDKKISFLSIVALPMLVLVAVYGLFMVVAAVVSTILQYPATLWVEALNISVDDNAVMLYIAVFVHYLICALSMFVGAYKKSR